jgi:hypothetical protein
VATTTEWPGLHTTPANLPSFTNNAAQSADKKAQNEGSIPLAIQALQKDEIYLL